MLEPLDPSLPVAAQLGARMTARAAEARAVATDEDVHEAVHEARRVTKELRATLRLVRPALGAAFRRHDRQLRDASRGIADARDAAATLGTVEALAAHVADDAETRALATARAMVTERLAAIDRAALRADVRTVLPGLDVVAALLAELPLPSPARPLLAEGLHRSQRRGRRAMSATTGSDDADVWHTWRKRVKVHRYHVELLDGWELTGPAHRERCKALSDLLGEDHDLAVLGATVGRGDPALGQLLDRRHATLRAQAEVVGRLVFDEAGAVDGQS